jgi:uncharacterized protein (TIGR02594 family)
MLNRRKLLTIGCFAPVSMALGGPVSAQTDPTCQAVLSWGFRLPPGVPVPAGRKPSLPTEVAKAFRLLLGVGKPKSPMEAANYFKNLQDRNNKTDKWLFREEWPIAERANPMIVGFFSMTQTLPSDGDQTSWCAAFVNFCLFASGYEGTDSALSGEFRKFGTATDNPKIGDIVVFRDVGASGDEGHGHVGIYNGLKNGKISVLGGNQRGQDPGSTGGVKVAEFDKDGSTLKLHSFRSLASFKKIA